MHSKSSQVTIIAGDNLAAMILARSTLLSLPLLLLPIGCLASR